MNTTPATTAITDDVQNNNAAATRVRVGATVANLLLVVSVVFSLVLVVAIGLPLVLEPKKRTRAASFNLYLVLLSTSDLVFAATLVVLMRDVLQRIEWENSNGSSNTPATDEDDEGLGFNGILGTAMLGVVEDNQWSIGIAALSSSMLVWIVAFVCHEILRLLRSSKQRKRCKPPSLRTVALHGLVACAVGITNYLLLVLDSALASNIVGTLGFSAPIIYSLWVAFRVVREGLTRVGAGVGNRLRVLVVYFARIILVYCVLLGCIALALSLSIAETKGLGLGVTGYVMGVLWALQGWASFAVILTKPDVRKMVRDLLVGKACFRDRTGGSNNINNNNQTTPVLASKQARVSPRTRDESTNQPRIPSQMREESTNRDEVGENEMGCDEGNRNLSREFIDGIVDYLSDNDGDANGDGDGDGDGDEETN